MKRDLSLTAAESDSGSYSQETGICGEIIGFCIVMFIFLTVIALGMGAAFTSYKKVREPKEYVVQSAFIEVRP